MRLSEDGPKSVQWWLEAHPHRLNLELWMHTHHIPIYPRNLEHTQNWSRGARHPNYYILVNETEFPEQFEDSTPASQYRPELPGQEYQD